MVVANTNAAINSVRAFVPKRLELPDVAQLLAVDDNSIARVFANVGNSLEFCVAGIHRVSRAASAALPSLLVASVLIRVRLRLCSRHLANLTVLVNVRLQWLYHLVKELVVTHVVVALLAHLKSHGAKHVQRSHLKLAQRHRALLKWRYLGHRVHPFVY